MTMSTKMQVLVMGIKRKLDRGEILEDILTSYVNLSEEEKEEIRQKLNEEVI